VKLSERRKKKSSTAIFEIQGIYGSKTNFMRSQSFVYLSNSGPSGLSFSNNSKARKSHAFVTLVSGENNYNFVFCMVLISQAVFCMLAWLFDYAG